MSEPTEELSLEKNVFSTPWKKSDVVLVVEDTEFHVHRSILTMQSPVFEAMLDGHFKEASQDKITLEGKTSEDMQQFLKLLYPPSMIEETLISFAGEITKNVFKMLTLADEYQARDVADQCLKETEITGKNAVGILPYAIKYNKSVHDKCTKVIVERMRMKDVDKLELAELDQQVVRELLIAKCLYLESNPKSKFLRSVYGY